MNFEIWWKNYKYVAVSVKLGFDLCGLRELSQCSDLFDWYRYSKVSASIEIIRMVVSI